MRLQPQFAAKSLPLIFAAISIATAITAAEPNGLSAKGQARLVREVRHELVMLPYYGVFDNLTYRVEGGGVTLSGQVRQPALRSNAERAVRQIEGVETVTNNIEVLPAVAADDQIRLAVYNSIYGHPALNRYALQAVPPIHIIVRNGSIQLVGVVNNAQDKIIAETQAKSVPGTFAVTNDLVVEQQAEK